MNKALGILFILLIFMSCSENKTPQIIEKEGYNVTLPGFVNEEELAEDAFIEYANRYRNFYIAAFKLPTNLPKDSLWSQSTSRITKTLENYTIDRDTSNQKILITRIKGSFKNEKEPLFYTQKIILGPNSNAILTVWTRGDERYKHHKETIDEIISSFKSK